MQGNGDEQPTNVDFPSEQHRSRFVGLCNLEVRDRCVAGSRLSCSIQAAKKCRKPKWLQWIPFVGSSDDQAKVARCEEDTFRRCLTAAAGPCRQHAETFCADISGDPESRTRRGGDGQ